jgi:metal-dependent amidase/aminoacylase/carboxypeptidase family protein
MNETLREATDESAKKVAQQATQLLANIEDRLESWEGLYRDLHMHPELSMQEHRTAGIVARYLRNVSYDVTEGVGHTGVVGVLRNGVGPTVMLRGDMDALPVKEQTGLDYASQALGTTPDGNTVPVMHACGHDFSYCILDSYSRDSGKATRCMAWNHVYMRATG